MSEHESQPEAAIAEQTPEPVRAPRDTRRILSGVQILEGSTLRTFAGDDEDTLDALERALTPDQYRRLRLAGALQGDWHPRGKEAAPMRGSRLEKLSRGNEAGSLQDAVEEIHRLRQRLSELERAREKTVQPATEQAEPGRASAEWHQPEAERPAVEQEPAAEPAHEATRHGRRRH